MTRDELDRTVIDDIKFGALSVMNKALEDPVSKGTDFEKWSAEDQAKYFLILDVQEEILRRVRRTLERGRRKKRSI